MQKEHEVASLPGSPAPTSAAPPRSWKGRAAGLAGVGLLIAVVAGGIFLLLRTPPDNGDAGEPNDQTRLPANLFQQWKKPDVALVVSGQMMGYLQPCGCSSPQYGGLARRYNFLKALRDKGWPVVPVDLGDIAQENGPQAKLKYEYAMKALHLMDYKAIGLGKSELLMPLIDALGNYSANHPWPRPLAGNLAHTQPGQLFHELNVRRYETLKAGGMDIGVVGVVGEKTKKVVEEKLPPGERDIKFQNNGITQELGAKKIDLGVLLYQGSEREARELAKVLHEQRKTNPGLATFHIILCSTEEEEPPSLPTKAVEFPDTCIITIGHKGRYVGVVGAWKTAKGLEFKYQLVSIGPEFQTPEGQEANNPVEVLMEAYAQKVANGKFLDKFPRSQHFIQAQTEHPKFQKSYYVGSEKCAGCHEHAYDIWKDSRHSHAYDTLVKARHPKNRQFDGECIVCHTVGFKYDTGYNDPNSIGNNLLKHVGCESCHGPGSEHVARPRDTTLYELINPYRVTEKQKQAPPAVAAVMQKQRMLRIDTDLCQSCHDIENDVHWSKVGFDAKWFGGKIFHGTPQKDGPKLQAKQVNGGE